MIKVEQLDGDPIRWILPLPELGGVKVLQGKESVAVDIATAEGREIVYELSGTRMRCCSRSAPASRRDSVSTTARACR